MEELKINKLEKNNKDRMFVAVDLGINTKDDNICILHLNRSKLTNASIIGDIIGRLYRLSDGALDTFTYLFELTSANIDNPIFRISSIIQDVRFIWNYSVRSAKRYIDELECKGLVTINRTFNTISICSEYKPKDLYDNVTDIVLHLNK